MGMSKLCVSFTIKGRGKKRTGTENVEPLQRTTTEIALSNSLILNAILSHLPHHDVLNCRLVSQSWNSEAISILRRQNAVIRVDGHNYQSYLFQILKTSHKSQSLLPYKCDQSLKLNVKIERYSSQPEFDKIALGLTTFVRLFESSCCIDALHIGRGLDWKMVCSWQKLIKSLTYCGAGLRHITINCAIVLDTPTVEEQQQAGVLAQSPVNAPTNPKALADARLLIESFSFPQLESLHLTLALGNNFSVLALTAIMNSAPRIRRLVVNGNGSSTSKYNCQLVQILRGVRTLTWLEELELDIGNGSCFQALRRMLLPQLTTLRLQCSNNNYPRLAPVVDQAQHFNFFLRCNCPSLTSLDFYFEPNSGGGAAAVGAGQEFPMGLPTLPNLKSFGYHGGALDACCYINVHKSALIPATMFPALDSVSTNFGAMLSFGQCIWSGAGGEDNANVRQRFTKVETLRLKLHYSISATGNGICGLPIGGAAPPAVSPSTSTSRCSIEDNVHQLRMLYPSLKQLVLDNEFNSMSEADAMAEIVYLLLCRFRTLEALEIRNYHRDWLSIAMASTGDVIPNLKQLTLSMENHDIINAAEGNTAAAIISLVTLTALLHFLPNLISLNLSSRLLVGWGSGGTEPPRWLTNGEYMNWYPNLKIKII